MNNNVLDEISQVLTNGGYENGVIEVMRLILNNTMEIERAEHLKANPYERTQHREGYASGFKDKSIATRYGQIPLRIPQTRYANFYPSCIEKGNRMERSLKAALAEMYVMGVSTGKVTKITEELCGLEISSSQVSRLTKELDPVFEQWRERPLGSFTYLVIDARYEKVRYGGTVKDLAVFWAIGITKEGRREVLGVTVSLSEAEVHWRTFFKSLVKRGLHGVEYIVSDDHSGLKSAIKSVFPGVVWQRCQLHLSQNAANHVSKNDNKKQVGLDIRNILQASDLNIAKQLLASFVEKYAKTEPALTAWAEENIPEGFNVFHLPEELRKKMRTSNMIERQNQEIKRRTRVVRIFPNENSCLRLVSAVLMEIHEEWISGPNYFSLASLES